MRNPKFSATPPKPTFNQIVTGNIPQMKGHRQNLSGSRTPPTENRPNQQTNLKKQRKPCNNWMETGTCRFGKNCAYEHPN